MAFQIGVLFLLKQEITLFYFLSFVFIRFFTRCHSLSLIVVFCFSLSFVVSCCTTRCHSLYHSMSFVVIRCHLLYHMFSFVVTCCHWMSLNVPLVCLFINNHYFVYIYFFAFYIIYN